MDDSLHGWFLAFAFICWAAAAAVIALRVQLTDVTVKSWVGARDGRRAWGRWFLPEPQTEDHWRGVVQRRTWAAVAVLVGMGLFGLLLALSLDSLAKLVFWGMFVGMVIGLTVLSIRERSGR